MILKNAIKKSLLILLSLTLTVSALVCRAAASQAEESKPSSLLALGDSITTGYGLDNYVPGETPYLCSSYANMIAKAMGLEPGQGYVNRAVNGDRSSDLAKLLPSLEAEVQAADVILISIGGNDLLSVVPEIASLIAGTDVTDQAGSIQVITGATSQVYAALAEDPAFQELFSTLLSNLEANLKTISGFLREKAPNARVVFLKQFNPLKNIPGFAAAGNFAETLLRSINSTLESTCTAYGHEVVDVPSVIDKGAILLTNILKMDIHPNEKGHTEIARLVAKHLGLSLGLPGEDTETQAPETPPETYEELTTIPEEPATPPEAVTTDAPETTAEMPPETGKEPNASETAEPAVEAKGCGATAGCGALLLALACAAYAFKKKSY